MSLPLRPARDSDAQDLFGLITLCFAEYPGCFTDPHADLPDLVKPGHWKERRGKDGTLLGGEFLVLEDETGRICACVAVDYPARDEAMGRPVAELHRLYVRPDCRRRGIAEALTARVEGIAREAGAIKLVLWSDTRFEGAHRLYRRLGYTQGAETRPLGDISNSIEYYFEKAL
ncbi:MAG: GNAT family N-acetyltransferase [Proteobacteria bacterium]|nr:GNAT family N-acetyltransferase [Pseudomonadota bacterium]